MVEVEREKLCASLRSVVSVVESDNSISVLQRLCFRDGTVCGSNGMLSIISACDVRESFCIDGHHLLKLHTRLATDKVAWTFKENKLIVKSGQHKSEVLTSEAGPYPNFLPNATTTLCTDCSGFAEAIKKCLSFTDDSHIKQMQFGGIGVKGHHVYGIDPTQCIRVKLVGVFAEQVVIPRASAKVLVGFGDPLKVLLTPGSANIVLLYNGLIVVCRLLEPKLPFAAVDAQFQADETYAISPPRELAAAVSRVALVLKLGGITLDCKDSVLTVSAIQESGGAAEEQIGMIGAADFTCKVGPDLFAKAVSAFADFDPGDVIVGSKRMVRFRDSTSQYAMALMT